MEASLGIGRGAPPSADDEPDFEDFFENGCIGLHLVDGQGTILRANKAELELMGYRADEYVGRPISDFHVDSDVIDDILKRLTAGERLDKYPARLRTKDGAIKHVQISSSVLFREGRFINTRCFTVDVTASHQAQAAQAAAERRLAKTYESVTVGIGETDDRGRFLEVNPAFEAITGYAHDELVGMTFDDLTHAEDRGDDAALYRDQVAGRRDTYSIEKRYVRKDGAVRFVEVLSSSVRDADGTFLHGVRVVKDVTDRKRAEDAQTVLIDELNHRVKNTLATVQSISMHTHRSTPDAFVERFEGRLVALSKAHDLLTRRRWTGVELGELLEQELAPYSDASQSRISLDGPDLMLSARVGLAVGMVLHELATNAAKYGALSADGGAVQVAWSVEGQGTETFLTLRWTESGGPRVETPTRRGFGRRLIERNTQKDLRGAADLRFAPTGLQCEIRFPL